jgi:hypothetical protein
VINDANHIIHGLLASHWRCAAIELWLGTRKEEIFINDLTGNILLS